MKISREKITTLSTIVALVVAASLFLNIPNASATCAGCGAGCGKIEEINPSTQNPHAPGEPQGNPHQFDSDCRGNPHDQVKTLSNPECPGAQ